MERHSTSYIFYEVPIDIPVFYSSLDFIVYSQPFFYFLLLLPLNFAIGLDFSSLLYLIIQPHLVPVAFLFLQQVNTVLIQPHHRFLQF